MSETTKKYPDIYKGKKEEVLASLEQKGYDREAIQKRLDEIKKTENEEKQKEITEKLAPFDAGSKEHINYLSKLLKENQKNVIEKTKDKLEKTKNDVEKAVTDKVENVTSGFMNKISEKFSGMFDKLWGPISKWIDKILLAIGGAFGINLLGDKKEETGEYEEEKKKDTKKEKKGNKTESDKNEKDIVTKQKNIETKDDIKYTAGIKTMLSLSGIEIGKNETKNPILREIKGQTYNGLILLEEKEKNQFLENGGDINTLNKIIKQFNSKEFKAVANYNFKSKFIQNIIEKNPKISEYIKKERLDKIIKASESGKIDWWKDILTISEISLFYTLSFSILNIPIGKGINSIKSSLTGLFFDKKETKNLENNLISKKIITNFTKNGLTNFGGKGFINNNDNTKNEIGKELNNNEKEQLDKLISFKDYILGEYLTQSKPELKGKQLNTFKNNLNYGHIIAIYSIMGGQKDVSKEGVINRFSLNYINSKVIGGFEGAKYIGDIAYNILFKTNTDIFSKEELEVLKIYEARLYDMLIGKYFLEIGKKLGFASGLSKVDLDKLALSLGFGGLGMEIIGKKMLKKSIEKKGVSLIGIWLKKLGWIGMLSGIAIGGYNFHLKHIKKDGLKNDLEAAGNDYKKICEILENYEKSIKNKEIDGKNISIIKYKNDTPLILMEGKVYTFDIIDAPILEKLKKLDYSKSESWKSAFKEGIREAFSWLPDTKTTKINGQIIDRTDVNINGDNISFGNKDSKKTFSITELFNGMSEEQIDKSTAKSIKEYFRKEFEKDIPFVDGKDTYFYKLKDLGKGKYISLVEIGTVPEEYQQKNYKNGTDPKKVDWK